jgi:GNAT superfamily N-acetyltransferase
MLVYHALGVTDATRIEAHLRGLDADDRYSRFHSPSSDRAIAAYVAGIDWLSHSAIGCFEDGALVGLVEIHYDKPFAPKSAEVAVSVERHHRGRGIGMALVARAVRAAGKRGVPSVTLHFLPRNAYIPRIVHRLGGRIDLIESEAHIDAPSISLYRIWLDGVRDAQASVASVILPLLTQAA